MSARDADGPDAESRENSPEAHDGSSEKRASKKRKVLSCYACRNRKMKCDRVYPVCGRCQKMGRADQCTYDPRLLEESHSNDSVHVDGAGVSYTLRESNVNESTQGHTSSEELRWKIRVQERRIEALEQKLVDQNQRKEIFHYGDRLIEEPEFKEEMMFRGKGFKTQIHGRTSVMSLIAQYRELQVFTREALTLDHSITRVKTDFKAFRDQRKVASKYKEKMACGSDDEVFATLPERNIVDVQVALYFRTWETTYKILHEPLFWKEYHGFWEGRAHDGGQVDFAVMLNLIVAATKCLTPKDDVFLGDTTADRHAASNIIDICDAWIGRQPRKRLTLPFFQVQCLALLAKRVNCVKLKQDWVTSGDLFRLALASGMHRDPSLLASGKISIFEKEMKKRLWITIMELELQSSLESGLQSSLTSLFFDTPAPANLPDDAFSTETHEMPSSRPAEYFTSTSYLNITLKSLPFRIHLAQLLNHPSSDMRYSDILHYDAQIHSMLSSIPSWDDERAAIPTALLTLQLRQYLLMLHKNYAKLALKNQRYMHSFIACVDASSSILATHEELFNNGILALNNLRNDVVRVGLTLSQVLYHNCSLDIVKLSAPPPNNTETHFADPHTHFGDLPSVRNWGPPDVPFQLASLPQHPFLTKTLCTSSVEVLHRSLHMFEQKVMRVGTGYMEFWLLCAAVGMLPGAPGTPTPGTSITYTTHANDDILSRCRITLDRFTNMTFRILALQKDPGNTFAVSLRDTMASVSPSDRRTPSVGASSGMGATPIAAGRASFSATSNINMGVNAIDRSQETEGPFDALQDMQVDLGEWTFPDFWAFDLGGDY